MRILRVALITSAGLACSIFESDTVGVGYIGDTGIPVHITLPDSAAVGALFNVSIAVYGSSSCTSVHRVEVEQQDLNATLIPLVRQKDGACTADLRSFVATRPLSFQRAGQARITVRGRFGALDERGRHVVRDTAVIRNVVIH